MGLGDSRGIRVWSRLIAIVSPRRRAAIGIVMLGFLASISEGIGIGLFIPFLQAFELQGSNDSSGGTLVRAFRVLSDKIAPGYQLGLIASAIFAAIALRGLLTFAHNALSASVTEQTGHDLRLRIFDSVLAMDFRSLGKLGAGRILNALMNESWRVTDAITVLFQIFVAVGTLGVYVSILVLISWKLTLLVILLMTVLVLAVRLLTGRVETLGKEITSANAQMASRIMDGANGIEVIRTYGREEHERKRFKAVSDRLARVTTHVAVLSGSIYPVYEILAGGVVLIVLLTSPQELTTLAPLLVFVFVLLRLAPIVKQLESARNEVVAASAAVEEVAAIIDRQYEQSIQPGTQSIARVSEEVVLEHVSFSYDRGSDLVLDDVSASIPAVGITAIVGPSGAGKSTLVRLLLRFIDPSKGRVLVDSTALSDLRLSDWRGRLAVVPQEVFLFSASVRENIAYGASDSDDEAIIAAAKAAGAHEFIEKLPQGYDTLLGEKGTQLSGGEGQRICLARALIRKPDILLLDEATNALDAISERYIQQALDRLSDSCAVVVIAHRLTTVDQADQILVLDHGKLVEHGTLNELVAQGGLFARLYRQSSYEQAPDRGGEYF